MSGSASCRLLGCRLATCAFAARTWRRFWPKGATTLGMIGRFTAGHALSRICDIRGPPLCRWLPMLRSRLTLAKWSLPATTGSGRVYGDLKHTTCVACGVGCNAGTRYPAPPYGCRHGRRPKPRTQKISGPSPTWLQHREEVIGQDRPAVSLEEATPGESCRRGAGGMRWRRSWLRMLVEETRWPSLSSSPRMRSYPRKGFSRASWSTSPRHSAGSFGRPGPRRRPKAAQRP